MKSPKSCCTDVGHVTVSKSSYRNAVAAARPEAERLFEVSVFSQSKCSRRAVAVHSAGPRARAACLTPPPQGDVPASAPSCLLRFLDLVGDGVLGSRLADLSGNFAGTGGSPSASPISMPMASYPSRTPHGRFSARLSKRSAGISLASRKSRHRCKRCRPTWRPHASPMSSLSPPEGGSIVGRRTSFEIWRSCAGHGTSGGIVRCGNVLTFSGRMLSSRPLAADSALCLGPRPPPRVRRMWSAALPAVAGPWHTSAPPAGSST